MKYFDLDRMEDGSPPSILGRLYARSEDQPGMITMGQTTAIVLQWVFVGFAVLAASIRAYNRFRTSNRPCPTDGMIFLSLSMFITGVGLNTFQYVHGDWTEGNIQKRQGFYQMTFASFLLFYTVLWAVKMTLISIYAALFPSALARLRLVVKATWYLVLSSYFFCLAMNLFSCGAPEKNWEVKKMNGKWRAACYSYKGTAYMVTLILHLLTEIIIFFLPFSLLHHFRSSLSSWDHIRVAAVFGIGILGIVTTIVRIICFVVDSPPQVVTTWLSLEQASAIIVVCSPALKKSFMSAMHRSIDMIIDTFRASLRRTNRNNNVSDRDIEAATAAGSEKSDRTSLVEILDVREKEMEEAAQSGELELELEQGQEQQQQQQPPVERWSALRRPGAVWNSYGSWKRGSNMSSAMSSTPGTIRIGVAW